MYLIYKCKNLINGKEYIGSTDDLDRRKREHLYRANIISNDGKSLFHKALSKYGFENFSWEVIYEGNEDEIRNGLEEQFIKSNNTHYKEGNGYNMVYSSIKYLDKKHHSEVMKKHNTENKRILSDIHKKRISDAMKKRKLSDEHKRKIGDSQKGRKFSPERIQKFIDGRLKNGGWIVSDETKKKMSESSKGKNNAFYGRKHSEESKEKLRKKLLGKTKFSYEITEPDGKIVISSNFPKYIKDNKLIVSKMYGLAGGSVTKYKGYKVKKITNG